MKKFRKKPVEVEAVLFDWTCTMLNELLADGMEFASYDRHQARNEVYSLSIKTLEGSHKVSKGDYIIKGVAGEFYPCKPDIFAKTYDVIEP